MSTLKYTQLDIEERDKISVLRAQGCSLREIASEIGRNRSTISRELRRNRTPVYDVYLSHRAHERALTRKREAAEHPRLKNDFIRRYVVKKVQKGWSPEQISGRISLDYPGHSISHEAIYQFIYDPETPEQVDLVLCLARSHRKRKKRGQSKTHKKSHIPNRIPIDLRPAHIESREQPGHWEADTIVSRQSKAALTIIVERKSRFVKIGKLDQKTAREFRKALNKRLCQYPKHMRRSITYDNGSENVQHELINKVLGTNSFFCRPYHSWEKGTVENTGGLVRRYLTKKTDFAIINKEHIKHIEMVLNNRPRKCLDYKTPKEIFKNLCVALAH